MESGSSYLDRLPAEIQAQIDYILRNQPFNLQGLPLELQRYVVAELPYPDVMNVERVLPNITDEYFWKLKTQRDFDSRNEYPTKDFRDSNGDVRPAENWREEYLSYGQELEPNLLRAAKAGNASVAQELLDLGVNPNTHYKDGETALTWASHKGHAEVVKAVLAAGADVDVWGEEGRVSALMRASKSGHLEVVKELLNEGADVNHQDEEGVTALYGASILGDLEVVKALLVGGADVTTQNNKGGTALMEASYGGDLGIVKALLAAGADVNARDDRGITALSLASRKGHHEVLKVLEEAKRNPPSLAALSRRALRRAGRGEEIPEYLQ